MTTQNKTEIRWLIRRDMPEVMEIEQACFEEPWMEEEFIKTLRESNCIGTVIEDEDRNVLGYMLYRLHMSRLEIVTLAITPDKQRQGLGRQLIERLVGKLSQQKRKSIEVTVNEQNLPVQLFLQSCRFRCVETLRGFYGPRDGYRMEYHID